MIEDPRRETCFFRDEHPFGAAGNQILPELMRERGPGSQLEPVVAQPRRPGAITANHPFRDAAGALRAGRFASWRRISEEQTRAGAPTLAEASSRSLAGMHEPLRSRYFSAEPGAGVSSPRCANRWSSATKPVADWPALPAMDFAVLLKCPHLFRWPHLRRGAAQAARYPPAAQWLSARLVLRRWSMSWQTAARAPGLNGLLPPASRSRQEPQPHCSPPWRAGRRQQRTSVQVREVGDDTKSKDRDGAAATTRSSRASALAVALVAQSAETIQARSTRVLLGQRRRRAERLAPATSCFGRALSRSRPAVIVLDGTGLQQTRGRDAAPAAARSPASSTLPPGQDLRPQAERRPFCGRGAGLERMTLIYLALGQRYAAEVVARHAHITTKRAAWAGRVSACKASALATLGMPSGADGRQFEALPVRVVASAYAAIQAPRIHAPVTSRAGPGQCRRRPTAHPSSRGRWSLPRRRSPLRGWVASFRHSLSTPRCADRSCCRDGGRSGAAGQRPCSDRCTDELRLWSQRTCGRLARWRFRRPATACSRGGCLPAAAADDSATARL